MTGRKNLPNLMEEAFGPVRLSEAKPRPKVVRMPTEVNPGLAPQVLDRLRELRLGGMAEAYKEQMAKPGATSLSFEQRIKHLLDSEVKIRAQRRLKTRLNKAALRVQATVADIDYSIDRGLDPLVLDELAQCQWIKDNNNLIITGSVGMGKTFLACALAHQAAVLGHSVVYRRLADLLRELGEANAGGIWGKSKAFYAKMDLLVIDDWGLDRLTQDQRLDLLDILEDRYGESSTLVASCAPQKQWPEVIGDSTLAEAIIDRLIHNSHRLDLSGSSMRKEYSPLIA